MFRDAVTPYVVKLLLDSSDPQSVAPCLRLLLRRHGSIRQASSTSCARTASWPRRVRSLA